MNRKFVSKLLATLSVAALGACGQAPSEEQVASTESAVPLHSERGGIGLVPQESGRVSAQAVSVDARRSLVVTDKSILANFSLQRVMDQFVAQSGPGGFTSTQLFRQLWDTQNPAPGQADLPGGAHCTDNGNTLNGFPYGCRTSEGIQASPTSLTTMASYSAVGLYNRFDLAPSNGADCGEYRIVYAKTGGGSGRNFIIFEATLPNPRLELGLDGCRPVAQFWADLTIPVSTDPVIDRNSRSQRLQDFYFAGLPGFSPVVHINHYGHNVQGAGQVRTNQFMAGPWLLREFKLQRECPTSTSCTLKFAPVTVKTNPFGGLFDPRRTDPQAVDFQNHFVTQVASLAVPNINTFSYAVPDRFNSGQSNAESFGVVDDYVGQFNALSSSPFRDKLQTELTRIGSTLTPTDIVRRAQTQSCGGCHQRSNGNFLGGGLPSWPFSASFVHSSDATDSADASRFAISSALTNTFLPHRKSVLEGFLDTPVRNATFVSQSVPTRVNMGSAFSVSVTLKNTGTMAWTAANGFKLGPQAPQDNGTWGVGRVHLGGADVIHQGQQKTFQFTAVAPSSRGLYNFQWKMLQESVTWFGDFSPLVQIEVVDPCYCPPKQLCPDVVCTNPQ